MSLNNIHFRVHLFETEQDKDRSRKSILWLMEALCQINKFYIETHPDFPSLYNSHVIYKADIGEEWKDIYNTYLDGFGDCEDLTCWRVGELQSIGINARPYIKWRKKENNWIYHALVCHPDDRIEDPSLALGMHGKIVRKPIFLNT